MRMNKDYRRFMRRIRASNMRPFLKTGCDMGWHGHFVGPVPTPKINEVLKKIDDFLRLGEKPDNKRKC